MQLYVTDDNDNATGKVHYLEGTISKGGFPKRVLVHKGINQSGAKQLANTSPNLHNYESNFTGC